LFRQPTDVAWDSKGNIYITDGYINSRVAKFSKDGDWVKQWGTKGNGPGQFNLPHSIAIDRNDNIYVGDRSNRRVQVFDTTANSCGNSPSTFRPIRARVPSTGPTPPGARLAGLDRRAQFALHHARSAQMLFVGETTFPGRIFKVSLDGKVLGVIGKSGRNLGQFSGAHALACPSETKSMRRKRPIGACRNCC
jgi:DNA-binding beta-propeller fold protein YncE